MIPNKKEKDLKDDDSYEFAGNSDLSEEEQEYE